MKKLRKNGVGILIAGLSLCIGVCSLQAACGKKVQLRTLTADDSGKTLALVPGDSFMLTLPDRVDGGFHYNKAQFDSTILRLDKNYEGPPNPDSRPGRPGTAMWAFTALKTGKTSLRITVSRPWAAKDSITNFQNLVLVK
jgi:inhibitor of cysteine peptidase